MHKKFIRNLKKKSLKKLKPFFNSFQKDTKFKQKPRMISKFSKVFSKKSFLANGNYYASDMKKFDYKDALLFRKLLSEEEIMVN